MAIKKVDIQRFLMLAKTNPVLDVRSPGEFAHAHFPGAVSIPLFTDEERKVVGTAYKQDGRKTAIKIGLDYFGPKMRKMVEEVENLLSSWPEKEMPGTDIKTGANLAWGSNEKNFFPPFEAGTGEPVSVLVHCWRGGMRSSAVAWLLDIYGFNVYLLEGGYKKFRNHVLETFKIPFSCRIIGGFTGSGKTLMLRELATKGLSVIDLEGLANHKGSAFGTVGPQPSQEMFENMLALALQDIFISAISPVHGSIWLEDESQRIGAVLIPLDLWEKMQHAPIYFIEIPFEDRLENIIKEYGEISRQDLIDAILRIQKRLGGLETKRALNFLSQNDTRESFRILLNYYDKSYLKSFLKRPDIVDLSKDIICDTLDIKGNAIKIINAISTKRLSI